SHRRRSTPTSRRRTWPSSEGRWAGSSAARRRSPASRCPRTVPSAAEVGGRPAPGTADAVLVCAGGRAERVRTALELMADGAAPALVVPFGRAPTWPEGVRRLRGPFPFELECPPPRPAKTRGEARLFRDLVASRGWTRVVLVTSTYHARRARL